MVTEKKRKMIVKGVKLKSESLFLTSPGVSELWRKNLRGGGGGGSSFHIMFHPEYLNISCPKWYVIYII